MHKKSLLLIYTTCFPIMEHKIAFSLDASTHRFLVLHPVWYHFSTSSLLCKVGTIFDIPTSRFSTITLPKKVETLVQQYFFCGCGGGRKGKCQYAIFFTLFWQRKTYVRIISNATLFCTTTTTTTSNIPFQAVNFIIPSFFTLGNEKFMLSLSYNSYYHTVYYLLLLRFDLW